MRRSRSAAEHLPQIRADLGDCTAAKLHSERADRSCSASVHRIRR